MSRDAEHQEQSALFSWLEIAAGRHHVLRLAFAVPNGGHRHIAVAAKLKKEGVKAGVPDVFLPVPRGKFHGLFLELTAGKNKATLEQRAWLEALSELGYLAVCVTGWEAARKEIENYLALRGAT